MIFGAVVLIYFDVFILEVSTPTYIIYNWWTLSLKEIVLMHM